MSVVLTSGEGVAGVDDLDGKIEGTGVMTGLRVDGPWEGCTVD